MELIPPHQLLALVHPGLGDQIVRRHVAGGDITADAQLPLRDVAGDIGEVLALAAVETGQPAALPGVQLSEVAVAAGDAGRGALRRLQLRIDETAEPIEVLLISLVGELAAAILQGGERVAALGAEARGVVGDLPHRLRLLELVARRRLETLDRRCLPPVPPKPSAS